ncbi:hypothetical protein T12_1788 [Trichinella patagoniensis]|uniref:Uncharacterized protein n=1 Tax=Trichinella patagoniensis TaxID=990121 RepID=A0A0V1ADS3_9BILA|nr:hypothetical protein T12_1788 [Trichinella patagoniensis]
MSGSGVIFHGVGGDQGTNSRRRRSPSLTSSGSLTPLPRYELRARSVLLPALYRSSLTISRMPPLRFG